MALGAVSNALDVQFIPTRLRSWWQTGIRDRLWNSRVGAWLARRLGAPEQSRAVGGGVFRATESALGVAAAELFEALPSAYREQLEELPAIVASLEARAAEARAELEVLDAMAPSGADAEVVADRRNAAKERLSESVAGLEGIRLDLLRLHAGASNLAPLTTLMDAARRIGEDVNRLAEAQQERRTSTSWPRFTPHPHADVVGPHSLERRRRGCPVISFVRGTTSGAVTEALAVPRSRTPSGKEEAMRTRWTVAL
jgi:serine/threonine-protein kinase